MKKGRQPTPPKASRPTGAPGTVEGRTARSLAPLAPPGQSANNAVDAEVGTALARQQGLLARTMNIEARMDALMRVGAILISKALVPDDTKSPAHFAIKILTGEELGLGAMSSLRMIDIIYNRACLRGQLVGALLRSRGCRITWKESTEKKAVVCIRRPDGDSVENTVTLEEVSKLRTTVRDGDSKRSIPLSEKDNWKQQPKVMLQRFALKQTANFFCEDMILGLYTDDEMDVIDIPARVVSPQESPLAETLHRRLENAAVNEPAPAAPVPAPPAREGEPWV